MSPAPTIRLASDSASNRPSAKSQARAWREGRDMGAACAVATGGLNALRSCAGEGIRQLLDIGLQCARPGVGQGVPVGCIQIDHLLAAPGLGGAHQRVVRSEEHTSELQSPCNLVCRLLLEKKKNIL